MKLKYAMVAVLLLSSISFARTGEEISEPQKVIILSLMFESNKLFVKDSLIAYGSPPNRFSRENALMFNIISEKGSIIDSYEIGDPRFVYDAGYVENTSFSVVLPYAGIANKIEVLDKNQTMASIDLSMPLDAFCKTKNDICDSDCKEDADCPAKKTEPIKSGDYSYLIIVALVLLSIALFYGYRKLKEMKILKEIRRTKLR